MPLARGPALFQRAWRWADRLVSGDAVTRSDLDAVADEIGEAITETYRIARRRAIPFADLPATGEPFEEIVTIQPDDRLHMRQWRITGWVTTHIMETDGSVSALEDSGQVAADTTPPPKPLGWFATPTLEGVLFRGLPSPATDFRAFRLWEADLNQPSILATLVDERAALQFQRIGMAQGTTRQFWISAVDTSGNDSEKSDVMIAGPAPTISDFDQRITAVEAASADAVARITTVETAYVTADEALASRVDLIEAEYVTDAQLTNEAQVAAAAAVATEAQARASADGALATRLDTIEADYVTLIDLSGAVETQVSAAVTMESLARASGDGALAARIDAIEADYVTIAGVSNEVQIAVSAAVAIEANARADQDSALANRLTTIEASYVTATGVDQTVDAAVTAAITIEEQARADADGALALRLDTVEAAYQTSGDVTTAVSAAIATEQAARVTADQALATRLDTIEASYETTAGAQAKADAAVATEALARADADAALALDVSAVQAQYQVILDTIDALDGNFGDVLTTINSAVAVEAQARADADAALSSRITTVEGSYVTSGAMTSAINAKATEITTAYAAADSGLSSRIGALEATVDTPGTGLAARITTAEQAIVDSGVALAQTETALRADLTSIGIGAGVLGDPLFATALRASSLGWARWNGANGASATVVLADQPGGQTVTVTCTDVQQIGMLAISTSAIWTGPKHVDAFVVEIDAELLSGSLSGAGILIDWRNSASVLYRVYLPLADMKASAASGTVRYQAIARRPDAFSGTPGTSSFYVMVNFATGLGTMAAKSLKVVRFSARPATAEELGTGEIGAAITTAVGAETTARTEAIANEAAARTAAINAAKSEITGGSTRTIAQVDAEQLTKVTAAQAESISQSRVAAELATGGAIASEIGAAMASVVTDTRFRTWLDTQGWTRSGSQGSLVVEPVTGGNRLVFTTTSVQQDGVRVTSQRAIWAGPDDAEAWAVEIDADLVSGDLSGAGILIDWRNTLGTLHRTALVLSDMRATGRYPTRYQGIVRKPSNFSGTFDWQDVYVFANRTFTSSPMAAKTLRLERVALRPATPEELGAGEVAAAITTAVGAEATARTEAIANETTARTAAITAAKSEITGGSTRTIAQVDTDQATKVTAAQADARADARIAAALSDWGPGGSISTAINAAVQVEATARANGDSALASQLTTLTANYNGTAATVTLQATAIAGLESREAAYKVVANAGVPGGFEIVSTAGGSKIKLSATEIVLDGTVLTGAVGADAITEAYSVNGTSLVVNRTDGFPVIVMVSAQAAGQPDVDGEGNVNGVTAGTLVLRRDGVDIASVPVIGSAVGPSVYVIGTPLNFYDTGGGGAVRTYSVAVTGGTLGACNITVLKRKR